MENNAKVKKVFDKKAKQRNLQPRDLVLMWDKHREKPGKHSKFDSLLRGPYQVTSVVGTSSFHLSHLDWEKQPLPIWASIKTLLLSWHLVLG